MIAKQGIALTFYALFVAAKVGKTGLTVTIDVYEGTNGTPIVSGGSATELAGGLYYYTLASGSVDADGAYVGVFKTADTSVDQQHIPAVWSIGNIIKGDTVLIEGADATETINAQADLALSDYDPPTKAELDSGLAALNDPTAAAIANAVWDEAIAGHVGAGSTGKQLSDTAQSDELPNEPPTTAQIADAIWDEALGDHLGAGSTGEALKGIPGATAGAVEYTYTVDDGADPIEGAEVWISTDSGGANVIWYGTTNAAGVALASNNEKPWLDAGSYYAWVKKGGYSFSNPDELTVS